jgi:hypothetical protein
MPAWTHDGEILFSRRAPGARVAWEFQPNRPDVDHFNREWKPELAKGGTEICRINPGTGTVVSLTRSEPPLWDFRASQSSNGKFIAFCRCAVGEMPGLWVTKDNGENAKFLTDGIERRGADQPRWLPQKKSDL